jgi:hypothetical protein
MKAFAQIPGWFDFPGIYDEMVARAGDGAVFVEVGAYLGRSTAYLASRIKASGKKIRLYVVDTWDGWLYDDYQPENAPVEVRDVFWHFIHHMRRAEVDHLLCPLRMASDQAAALFAEGTLDFVFIDANHAYEAVKQDLVCWFPRVKRRGILAGHDYLNEDFPGVRRAVDEFCSDLELPLQVDGTSFLVTKPRPRWFGQTASGLALTSADARPPSATDVLVPHGDR